MASSVSSSPGAKKIEKKEEENISNKLEAEVYKLSVRETLSHISVAFEPIAAITLLSGILFMRYETIPLLHPV